MQSNAAIAQVLTVMARTPVPGKPGKDAITAFLVTPDMPGFEVIEQRMEKLGIRREGLAERYMQIAGGWEDHVLFALTREEWDARRRDEPDEPDRETKPDRGTTN